MQQIINSFQGPYYFLSNFHPCIIIYGGVEYPSTEHYYQAMKTLDQDKRAEIGAAPSPGKAKRLGQRVELRPDWEDIKDDVMLYALRRKFSIPFFEEKLLATDNAVLIEGNTWNDTYWGVCDGQGKNMLGKLLMQVRSEIRDSKQGNTTR